MHLPLRFFFLDTRTPLLDMRTFTDCLDRLSQTCLLTVLMGGWLAEISVGRAGSVPRAQKGGWTQS